MFRLGLGLVLIGLIAAVQAAQPDEDYFVPKLNLITTQFAHPGTGFLPAFQIGASVVFTRPPDNMPIESGRSSASPLSSVARLQQEIAQATNTNRQLTNGSDHISLSQMFRVEFKEAQVNVAVRPHSVLIERKQLKIMLQPDSTSVTWSKAF